MNDEQPVELIMTPVEPTRVIDVLAARNLPIATVGQPGFLIVASKDEPLEVHYIEGDDQEHWETMLARAHKVLGEAGLVARYYPTTRLIKVVGYRPRTYRSERLGEVTIPEE